jgi:uncharacterized membrane protein/glutaredoxin
MIRSRKQVPWIHQYSRLLIGSIAILGILVTAYLTWVKLSNNGVCGTEGCETVLASPYANVGDFPLTGLGLLSYLGVALMAFAPTVFNPKTNKAAHTQINNLTWLGLLIAGVGMAVFSGYLMYLLAFVIKAICPFCIVSAIFTFSIFALTLIGHDWEDVGQIVFTGMATALLAIVVSLVFYNTAGGPVISSVSPTTPPVPGVGWQITSTSSPAEIRLAKYLTEKGAKMYGSYWCPHCYEQKQLFGKQAWEQVTYIECGEGATEHPSQTAACNQAGVKSYPTWFINGKLDIGGKKLAKLAKLTGYTGNTEFKYDKLFNR